MVVLGLGHTHSLRPHPSFYEFCLLMPYAKLTSYSFLDSNFNEYECKLLESIHWLLSSALAELHP